MDETNTQPNTQAQELQDQISGLQAQVTELRDAFYRNNFSQQQVFNKYCDFTTRIKIPVVTALANCEIGELCFYSGDLWVATDINTWTIVGTQS